MFNLQYILAGLAMATAAALAAALTPTEKLAAAGMPADIEGLIPKQFGEWFYDPATMPLAPGPTVQQKLDGIYNQALLRTYVNAQGDQIMLLIAYGDDQSDALQVHRPEACYPAQGFQITPPEQGMMVTPLRRIPVRHLVAQRGARIEPITYWITLGDQLVLTRFEQKLAQLRYGLTGYIPDGLLVRISSLNPDAQQAYQLHENFISSLLAVAYPTTVTRLLGNANT